MISLVRAQLLFRRGRLLATLAAVAVAVASFSLLASAARGSQLRATGTVTANYRPVYDILVRPAAGQAGEQGTNLLRTDDVADRYGGISTAQWQQILAVPGVSVAAPVAMAGYVVQTVAVPVDLRPYLRSGTERQLFKVQPTLVSDRGRSQIRDGASYLWATSNRLTLIPGEEPVPGRVYGSGEGPKGPRIEERGPDGTIRTICTAPTYSTPVPALEVARRRDAQCWSSDPASTANRQSSPQVFLTFPIPLLMAAVDPVQEAKLGGLDAAVVSGGYLPANDGADGVPVLASSQLSLDEQMRVQVLAMGDEPAGRIARGVTFDNMLDYLDGRPATELATSTVTAQDGYRQILDRLRRVPPDGAQPAPGLGPTKAVGTGTFDTFVDQFWTAGPTRLTGAGADRAAAPVMPSGSEWGDSVQDLLAANPLPIELADQATRTVVRHEAAPSGQEPGKPTYLYGVGVFDPAKVDTGPALARMPFDVYAEPGAAGADAASRAALAGEPLLPNANFGGPAGQRPALLTTLTGLAKLHDEAAYQTVGAADGTDAGRPISTVRVRVEGEVGMDSLSQERVRAIADRIRQATGLQVDLLVGSSTTGVPVLLPAGRFGRPALTVDEPWLKLGVAATIVSAIDRKSLILAILVMVACALAVGNATSAAVRTRATELGVLACLGWPRWRLFALVLTEALTVGAVAGVLGTILALALSPALDIGLSLSFALLAVPAAVLLCLLSALLPAWRATRADPAAAVRPQVALVRRKRVPRRVSGLALGNVLRAPGRTAVGALSLSIGVAALTLLIIVNLAFRGSASGTVLGDAITLQVQKTDYIAAALTTLLGAATVADVLYVNIRERSAEFALLGAVGWTDGLLTRLAGYEAVVLGAVGSVTGAGLALATAAGFSGALPPVAYVVAGVTVLCGIVLSIAAAVFPVRALRSLPTAQLLAEE